LSQLKHARVDVQDLPLVNQNWSALAPVGHELRGKEGGG
jgi:hypothetical protein